MPRYDLVADIGLTNTRLAWADGHQIVSEHKVATHRSQDLWPGVVEAFAEFGAGQKIGEVKVSTTGAVVDGVVELQIRVRQFDLRRALSETFDVPVRVANDMTCLALGELHAGAGRGMRDGMVATVSSGINVAIVRGGVVLPNSRRIPDEYGLRPVPPSRIDPEFRAPADYAIPGLVCYDNYASGSGVFARAKLRGLEFADKHELDLLAEAHDPVALELYMDEGRLLAEWLAEIIAERDEHFELIVLQGTFARRAFDYLRLPMQERLRELAPEPPKLRLGELGDDGGLIGATYL